MHCTLTSSNELDPLAVSIPGEKNLMDDLIEEVELFQALWNSQERREKITVTFCGEEVC